MQRAALRLSLILVAALCVQPFNHAQNNPPDIESSLRSVVDELFAAYAKEDIDGYMKPVSYTHLTLPTIYSV